MLSLREQKKQVEHAAVIEALKQSGGVVRKAAKLPQITERRMHQLTREYDIKKTKPKSVNL